MGRKDAEWRMAGSPRSRSCLIDISCKAVDVAPALPLHHSDALPSVAREDGGRVAEDEEEYIFSG